MARSPVTVVIPVWNVWESTRACLDSLRPTLGIRDQVVVVDNGSSDTTAAQLRRYAWVDVVTNTVNRGFAGGGNDGAGAARHDVLVFLNNDTVPTGNWIDPLVAALDDPTVAAAGSQSNRAPGPQSVDTPGYSDDVKAMRRFARDWSHGHRGQRSDTDRLDGFCLAVRRSAFQQAGGFDESYGTGAFADDDLCLRLGQAGHRLAICHDSFVHHEGQRTYDANGLDWRAEQAANRDRFAAAHPGVPARWLLVSACLITKDEEVNLPICLASLREFADEVVVYDTGSKDGTVELARSLGATVIEGYWDDDFARARNASLAHCRGEWIAWLDADETLVCDDVAALRRHLARTKGDVEGWSLTIHNVTGLGTGSGFDHRACRLFRRATCEWIGRLHEQITRRGQSAGVVHGMLDAVTIYHTGYLDEAMRTRNKSERNLRVAQAEVDEAEGQERGASLVSLARSYLTAGRCDESFARAAEALESLDNPITRRLALRTCTEALLGLGRVDEALEWAGRLRDESTDPLSPDLTEAKVRQAGGEHERALELLLGHLGPKLVDEDGYGYPAGTVAALRATSLAHVGRYSEAADALITTLFEEGALDAHLGAVIDYLQQAGRPLTELAAAIPADNAPAFLAQVLQIQPGPADAVLEACLERMANRDAVLAAAATLAKRLPLEQALMWSARLRAAGHGFACPLMGIATSAGPAVLRARAAATALAAFGDDRAPAAFHAALAGASPAEEQEIRAEASQLCPALLAPSTR